MLRAGTLIAPGRANIASYPVPAEGGRHGTESKPETPGLSHRHAEYRRPRGREGARILPEGVRSGGNTAHAWAGREHHAPEFRIGDSVIMLSDEMPSIGANSPQAYGGTPVKFYVYVENIDAAWKRAVDADKAGRGTPGYVLGRPPRLRGGSLWSLLEPGPARGRSHSRGDAERSGGILLELPDRLVGLSEERTAPSGVGKGPPAVFFFSDES
jgi:hypothetical protein